VRSGLYLLISNLAIGLCFLPFVLLWFKKLLHVKAYLGIAIYWMCSGFVNLPHWMGQSQDHELQNRLTLLYNLLDGPLALLVFLFAFTGKKRRAVGYTLVLFILFELVMVAWKGYNFDSSTVIIGVDLLLVLIYSTSGVLQYLKEMEHTEFETSMVFIYAALLFDYGVFIIIYIFSYLRLFYSQTDSNDNFWLYYISLFLSVLLTCFGLWQYAPARKPEPR
jgi:hypothetical protein